MTFPAVTAGRRNRKIFGTAWRRLGVQRAGRWFEVVLALPNCPAQRAQRPRRCRRLPGGGRSDRRCTGRADPLPRSQRNLQRRARCLARCCSTTRTAPTDSVRASIDVLAATIGKKIIVLGDMGEIGDMTAQFPR